MTDKRSLGGIRRPHPVRRSIRSNQPYIDTVLVKATFRAAARRARQRAAMPAADADGSADDGRQPRWRLVTAGVLLAAMIGALLYSLSAVITQTRPFAAPSPFEQLAVFLPTQLNNPHVVLSFVPGQADGYTTAAEPDPSIGLSTGVSSALISIPGVNVVPVLAVSGAPVDTSGWTPVDSWKVLLQVIATTSKPQTAMKSLPTVVAAQGPSGLFSHFITETYLPCGGSGSPQVANILQSYDPEFEPPEAQGVEIFPCPDTINGKHFVVYSAEGVLRSGVETDAAGHVTGALPQIDVLSSNGQGAGQPVPYQVFADEPYSALFGGLQSTDLSAVDVSPQPSSLPSPVGGYSVLLWDARGLFQARWSWTVIGEANHSQEIANVYLVLIGVTSALIAMLGGYLVKGRLLAGFATWVRLRVGRLRVYVMHRFGRPAGHSRT